VISGGFCECGCGELAPLAQKTSSRYGWTKGEPLRFVQGHNARVQNWKGGAANYSTIHEWLRKHFPKTGCCEKCGRVGRTDWAFLFHPQSHTRNRDDYIELCRSCHLSLDEAVTGRAKKMRRWLPKRDSRGRYVRTESP
jgi:hypothetical protein